MSRRHVLRCVMVYNVHVGSSPYRGTSMLQGVSVRLAPFFVALNGPSAPRW
jgi:hypothetical protein